MEKPITVLAAGQEPAREAVREALEGLPLRILQAASWRAALRAARAEKPDAIFLDLDLAGGRAIRRFGRIPVIALGPDAPANPAARRGFRDRVAPPFRPADLARSLARCLAPAPARETA